VILVCAATGAEARACRRGLADARADAEVLCTGVGPARAADALGRRLRRGPTPALVVSSGFAGALTPDLPLHGWVTADALLRIAGGAATPLALPPGLLRVADAARPCCVVSGAEVLRGAPAGVGGPVAGDMESAALAEAAADAGVPFLVLRLVTDTPAAPMHPLGRIAADYLATPGRVDRARHAARAAAEALSAPLSAAGFVRASAGWCALLRDGWRARAASLQA
jgi:hypothetical protein